MFPVINAGNSRPDSPAERFRSGKHPMVSVLLTDMVTPMKSYPKKKSHTFAGLIAEIYDTCGKQRARGIIRLACKAHLVHLPGGQRVEFV